MIFEERGRGRYRPICRHKDGASTYQWLFVCPFSHILSLHIVDMNFLESTKGNDLVWAGHQNRTACLCMLLRRRRTMESMGGQEGWCCAWFLSIVASHGPCGMLPCGSPRLFARKGYQGKQSHLYCELLLDTRKIHLKRFQSSHSLTDDASRRKASRRILEGSSKDNH